MAVMVLVCFDIVYHCLNHRPKRADFLLIVLLGLRSRFNNGIQLLLARLERNAQRSHMTATSTIVIRARRLKQGYLGLKLGYALP